MDNEALIMEMKKLLKEFKATNNTIKRNSNKLQSLNDQLAQDHKSICAMQSQIIRCHKSLLMAIHTELRMSETIDKDARLRLLAILERGLNVCN